MKGLLWAVVSGVAVTPYPERHHPEQSGMYTTYSHLALGLFRRAGARMERCKDDSRTSQCSVHMWDVESVKEAGREQRQSPWVGSALTSQLEVTGK